MSGASAVRAADDEPTPAKDEPRRRADDGRAGRRTPRPRRTRRRRAPTPSLRVIKLQFRGNRKVEDDAIKVNLKTAPGVTLTQEMLREDVRAIWKMGYFDDVAGRGRPRARTGSVVTFVARARSRRSARSTSPATTRSRSTKINEVLDIKKEQILDLAKVKKNVEKIKDLYVEKGFYMAEVDYEVKRDTASEVDVWFHVDEHAKVEVGG